MIKGKTKFDGGGKGKEGGKVGVKEYHTPERPG